MKDQQPDYRGSLIALTVKFVKSYHAALSCTLLENDKFDLEQLTEDKLLS